MDGPQVAKSSMPFQQRSRCRNASHLRVHGWPLAQGAAERSVMPPVAPVPLKTHRKAAL
jgi:hypothetical protein